MKQYVFSPIDKSFKVSYLTNGISTNDRLFINEIKSEVAGVVTPGLLSAGQAIGLFQDYLETTVTLFKAKAVALNLTLTSYIDRSASVVENLAIQLLTFTLPSATAIVIDQAAGTITLSVPFGTNPASLIATFTKTANTTVKIGNDTQTSASTANNFTNPVTYALTGTNGAAKSYVVTVTVLAS